MRRVRAGHCVRLRALVLVTLVVACSRPQPKQDSVAQAEPVDCSGARGDSAFAVCLATRPDSGSSVSRRVEEFAWLGDTACVATHPGSSGVLDGSGRIKVVHGLLVAVAQSDSSIGCR